MSLTDLTCVGTEFWHSFQLSAVLFPYVRKELDRKYNWNSKIRKLKETDPDLIESLKGKVCVMTGGTRGIGAEVLKPLLRKDCHVVVGSSSKDHQKTYKEIRAEVPESSGKLEIWDLDLRSMDSVVKFASKVKESNLAINYFIANAGVYKQYELTKDQFELTLAVNYLSHCLLIDHLIDNLYETSKASKTESRIVLTSSAFHKLTKIRFEGEKLEMPRSLLAAYGRTKLAAIMFTIRMNRWLNEKGDDWAKSITINCLHPGLCNTSLMDHLPLIEQVRPLAPLAMRSSKEGAETTIYAALSNRMNGISGTYLEDCAVEEPSPDARSQDIQKKLWDFTWNSLKKWTIHTWI